jgi:anti-sigma-K factor RskA
VKRPEQDERDCAQLREVAAEFVLGTLDGHERAAVVEHLATCARCRAEVSSLSGAVSDLALLAPRMPPSPGFTNRVLAAMEAQPLPFGAEASPVADVPVAGSPAAVSPPAGPPAPAILAGAVPIGNAPSARRSRWRRPLIALVSAAAAVVLLVAGLGLAARHVESRGVLEVAAMVDARGTTLGTSTLANGLPGTVHVSVTYPSDWVDYQLEVVETSGAAIVLGPMHLKDGSWQWSGRLPARELRELRIVRPDGQVTCEGMVPA